MPFRPFLRSLALPIAAGLLSLGLACKGKNHGSNLDSSQTSNQVVVSGTVTFDRIPVVRDAAGLPLGLETAPARFLTNLPARNVRVVLYEQVDAQEKDASGTPVIKTFYRVPDGGEGLTQKNGTFTFAVTKGVNYMLEVQSSVTVGNSASLNTVNLLADPLGMASRVPVVNRLRYCFRQDLAGNKPPTAAGVNHVAFSSVQADTTVNFHIGVGDRWFLADTDRENNASLPITHVAPSYSPGHPRYAEAGAAEAAPSGSKIIGMLDSIASFSYSENVDGSFFPVISGGFLDLNYVQGVSESGGTYVEFDRASYPLLSTQQSVAFDPYSGILHYMGSIRGAAGQDDAWDEGALFTLLARSSIYSQFLASHFYSEGDTLTSLVRPPVPIKSALPGLHPNVALIEGLPELMAALVQKNPYLGLAGTDIRDLGGLPASQKTIFAAPLVRVLGWQAALLEHGLPTPGTPADWSRINIANMRPYLIKQQPADSQDTPNLYLQLKNLAATTSTPGGLNPSTIFTDAAVQSLLSSAPLSVPAGNIPWPRPAAGPLAIFNFNWGTNPNGVLPSVPLSMSDAVPVGGSFPNLSRGEMAFGSFTQTGVKSYLLTATLTDSTHHPITLTNGQVEVSFYSDISPNGAQFQPFLFTTSTSAPIPLLLEGKAGTDAVHFVRIRMHSPTTTQPDTIVSVTLTPQS